MKKKKTFAEYGRMGNEGKIKIHGEYGARKVNSAAGKKGWETRRKSSASS